MLLRGMEVNEKDIPRGFLYEATRHWYRVPLQH